jgi:hypothetical protein
MFYLSPKLRNHLPNVSTDHPPSAVTDLDQHSRDPARPNPNHDRHASAPGKSAPASRIQPGSAIIRHLFRSLHGNLACPNHR